MCTVKAVGSSGLSLDRVLKVTDSGTFTSAPSAYRWVFSAFVSDPYVYCALSGSSATAKDNAPKVTQKPQSSKPSKAKAENKPKARRLPKPEEKHKAKADKDPIEQVSPEAEQTGSEEDEAESAGEEEEKPHKASAQPGGSGRRAEMW